MTKSDAGRPHPCGPGTVLLKNVYHMLAYAFTALETGEHRRLAGEEFDHIHDLLAAILIEGLESQRRRGFERDYESFEEDLALVRGRIDPAATMRLGARRSRRVRCRYDERTENTVVNRILKTAARRLLLHGDVTRRRRARLKSVLLGIGNVEILSGEELRRHHPGLRPAAPWVSGGIENAPAFLPGMHTDVVLTGPSRTLIIDTKCHGRILGAHHDHKILSAGNRNQIYGYVMHEAHDPRQRGREVEGMLLYAQTTVDPPLRETWIETGHRFHVRTLDLDQDFTGIASRLDEIAGLIKAA